MVNPPAIAVNSDSGPLTLTGSVPALTNRLSENRTGERHRQAVRSPAIRTTRSAMCASAAFVASSSGFLFSGPVTWETP